MQLRSLALLLGALAACGGGDDSSSDSNDTGPDGAAACSPSALETTIMIGTVDTGRYAQWQLDAVASPHAVVAHAIDSDVNGALRVGRIEADQPEPVVLGTLADAANYQFHAAALPGSDCAVVSSSKTGLATVCPGQPIDTATAVRDISGDPVFPVQTPSSLFIYTQTFASFTEIEHPSANVWQEHEQFESSISFPTDALLAGTTPVACFISSGDHAVVAYGSARTRTTVTARWCKLALDGDTLTVLTDAGASTVQLGSLVGEQGTLALTPTTIVDAPVRLVTLDGAAYALVIADPNVELRPIAGGAPITIPGPSAGGGNLVLGWNAVSRSLTEVTTRLDTSGAGPLYPQSVVFETRCLP